MSLLDGIDRAVPMKADVLDKLDIDQTVDAYGDLLGVPSRLIASTDKAAAVRQQRAQVQQQQMALQAGQRIGHWERPPFDC